MGGETISQSATRIPALQLQSSAYGVTIPLVYGVTKVPGNIAWYGGFTAISHTETQGGKGGGGMQNTTYTYTADVVLLLGHGVITGVPRVWRGKSVYYDISGGATALANLGISLQQGTIGQSVWSGLSSYGDQALGYSGMATLAAQAYGLGSNAQFENHLFEVEAPHAYHLGSGIPDVDPSLVMSDVLFDSRAGAGLPGTLQGDWTRWSDWCVASGLLVSPALTTQQRASEVLDTAARLTATAPVWSGGVLKMLPYGDAAVSARGRTYAPDTTPVYVLDDECWLSPPVGEIKSPADRYNHVRVEYLDRYNSYSPAIAEATDAADIDANGKRSMDVVQAHWICEGDIARHVAQLLMQRSLYIANTYTAPLPWHFALLEPMDLVPLTDPGLGLASQAARVTVIEEGADGELTITFEEYPAGTHSAVLYAQQQPDSFAHDWNVAPGSARAPVIFEAPGQLTANGLELYIASAGLTDTWGGAQVWVSLDGTHYRQVGSLTSACRYGTLSASTGSTGGLSVALNAGMPALSGGSAADAAALNTLCYVRASGGGGEEFLAFETATLTSAQHYALGGTMARGAYGTPAATHASGDTFVRVDDSLAKSGPIDLGYVGRTVHVKLVSFNLYGGGLEDISTVTDYTYTITGARVYGNAGAAALQGVLNAASDNLLTAGEKPQIVLDAGVIASEQSGIDAQATNYGVTTEKTAYDTAVAALATYLATLTTPTAWNNLSGDTTIVGSTFRAKFSDVYLARQALRNKIDANAKARLGGLAVLNAVDTGQIAAHAVTDGVVVDTSTTTGGSSTTGATGISGLYFGPTVTCTADDVLDIVLSGEHRQVLFFDAALLRTEVWITYQPTAGGTSIEFGKRRNSTILPEKSSVTTKMPIDISATVQPGAGSWDLYVHYLVRAVDASGALTSALSTYAADAQWRVVQRKR